MLTAALLLSLLPVQEINWKAAGQQAYLYAYPLVLMDATHQAAGSTNTFVHAKAFPDDKFRQVVRPNADTLYSNVWLDLSKEPMLLHVPNTHGRYYLMQLLDAWTETIDVPGKRTTGTEEGWFAIVGPGWTGKLPAGVRRIDCPTNLAWIIGRTQTNGAADYRNVHGIQDGYRIMPLSRYPDGTPNGIVMIRPSEPPPLAVMRMPTAAFFSKFKELLKGNPPHQGDPEIVIGDNADFEAGVQQAKQILAAADARRVAALSATNWSKPSASVGRYGKNFLARAFVARVGLGANPPEDAVYLNCYLDSSKAPLTGALAYRIHFEKGQLPPVNAFWSITVYDAAGYFVANPMGRYAIGDRDALRFNEDGSLDIVLQNGRPSDISNWLPTPEGEFNLSFRLYWPKEEILRGIWSPPAVVVVR